MYRVIKSRLLPLVTPMLLVGCCDFVPCHPATSILGSVATIDSQPVGNAEITLYGSKRTTDEKGCFKMRIADGLPFTFEVAALGYKSATIEAKPGFYRVQAKLASSRSVEQSNIVWFSISAAQYESSAPCNP